MAVSSTASIMIIPRGEAEKSRRRASLCRSSRTFPKTSVSFNKSSTDYVKVFEDKELGVICFRNESGEIVCEGFDEGPRFESRTLAGKRYKRRNSELQIPNFLQIMSVRGTEDDDFYWFTRGNM